MTKEGYGDLPVLIAQTGKLNGSRWVIDSEELVIGRGPECGLMVPDRQVSRAHARIFRTPQGYLLEDLSSKNGTHLNGNPVKGAVRLQDGDVIQIALALKMIFVGTESTIPLKPAEISSMGLGRLRMAPDAHRVWIEEQEVEPPLSPPQYRLLELLYRNSGRVVSREQVIQAVWPEAEGVGVSEQAIDALVRRLRDRLLEYDPNHSYIVTVRGRGFRLENAI